MSNEQALAVHNGEAFATSAVTATDIERFRGEIIRSVAAGQRIAAMLARPDADGGRLLVAVLADDAEATLHVVAAPVDRDYPSITPESPQAQAFERDIHEQWGIVPIGHPWLKPLRFPPPATHHPSPATPPSPCGAADFFAVQGVEPHEVAVGPVHAGIIEPGHFRFLCHGETVDHLEISLGYQHRGVERAMLGGPNRRTIHYMETLSGDTSIGHAMAYCRAVESLSETRVPARAQVIRGVALELERVANHVGDLGAMAGDVGYLPTMSYCGRIRGDVLNATAMLCGNRFGRGLVRPGGVAMDLAPETASEMRRRLAVLVKDARSAVELLWETPSVMARFDQTGTLSRALCEQLGLVGIAARACGVARDVRSDFSYGIYRFAQIPVSTWHTGDVFARAYVRWLEVQRSLVFIDEQLESLPEGSVMGPLGAVRPDHSVVALVEGWRGEICHAATTDAAGRFLSYKVVDPSLHNWFGLAAALRNQQVSDFPLCNKSFNLSYCGHDL
jgi:Ni,Fe-hydrogenase III large subunit